MERVLFCRTLILKMERTLMWKTITDEKEAILSASLHRLSFAPPISASPSCEPACSHRLSSSGHNRHLPWLPSPSIITKLPPLPSSPISPSISDCSAHLRSLIHGQLRRPEASECQNQRGCAQICR
ncbi:hypothetical protein SLEP1_g21751 [Rubroshorea leprosula]|uniref:Uncharacterized protein n=1 Tax=Rubroshorea leprosula TaxID=152421 RepID=A0AAV5JHK0_9ROSI|nr:hypothetical protein SLEP1_g21751 [Rubroshorea leprosula]